MGVNVFVWGVCVGGGECVCRVCVWSMFVWCICGEGV